MDLEFGRLPIGGKKRRVICRPRDALRDCNESLRRKPDKPAILDSRALAYWLLDDQDSARQDLDRAHQIDPSFPSWQDRFHEFEGMF
jgi:tetratricopeptide (TPR) repeat protein